jgi:hypothetical protein
VIVGQDCSEPKMIRKGTRRHDQCQGQLTDPIPFNAASILLTLAARASFFLVLRFPRFDSSNMHS